MKTTFVLGAGASKGIGYPLAQDLGAGLLLHMSSSTNKAFIDVAELLAIRFGPNPDVAELLETIERRVAELSNTELDELKVEREDLKHAQSLVGPGLIDWFRSIHENSAPNYNTFAKYVAPNDSIITFNYDDSLERELARAGKWSIGSGYGFDLDATGSPSKTTIFKLHGSMNWMASLFEGTTHGGSSWEGPSLGTIPMIHPIDLKFLACDDFKGKTFPGGVGFPLLVLPYKEKKFGFKTSLGHEYKSFWDLLWTQARNNLQTSERVIIIGYSLALVDQRARSLLLADTPKDAKVEIVCGNQSKQIADDFQAYGYPAPVAFDGYFSEWLEVQR